MSIIRAVAPTLDNNPRRIMQFMNVMRLRTYIAATTGRLTDRVTNERRDLTLERIGKFVAVQLMYPKLVADLSLDETLIHSLQNATPGEEMSGSAKYWSQRLSVKEIFAVGMKAGDRADYDLGNVDAEVLLGL